jgi:uncharacterized protein
MSAALGSVVPMVRSSLSAAEARRTAIAAQGFGRLPDAVSTRALSAGIARLGLLQIDSVNVFERSHYLPLFARLGAYDRDALDRLTMRRRSPMVEYWAHEAAFVPRTDLPLFRWKMDALRERDHGPTRVAQAERTADLRTELTAVLRANGPLPASAVEHESNVRRGPWWGWSDVKLALEYMFRWGDVVSAGRKGFERVYALPDQVLEPGVLESAPERTDAVRELVRRSARALGVGTLSDIADYYRLRVDDTRAAVRDLESDGVLAPVSVEGWGQRAWRRPRAERMFGFHYRIEIYTPAPKRVFGYYVLPVLQDDRVVGRVDLKSDRQRGVLRVRTTWAEPGQPFDPGRLGATLLRTAAWQGLDGIEVTDRGTGAAALADALGVPLVPHVAADDADATESADAPTVDATTVDDTEATVIAGA